MRYISTNELCNLNFHDAELRKIDFDNNNMIWQLFSVVATKHHSQNPFGLDMFIKESVLVFEQFNIERITFDAYKIFDSSNNLIKSVEEKIANPDEYIDILTNSLNNHCYIYSMEELSKWEDNKYTININIDGDIGHFDLNFRFQILIFNGTSMTEKHGMNRKTG